MPIYELDPDVNVLWSFVFQYARGASYHINTFACSCCDRGISVIFFFLTNNFVTTPNIEMHYYRILLYYCIESTFSELYRTTIMTTESTLESVKTPTANSTNFTESTKFERTAPTRTTPLGKKAYMICFQSSDMY